MSSPFPGMDPYLENPASWPDVHHNLISSISDALIRQIAPRYYVTIDPRVYSVVADDSGSILLDPEIREARLMVVDAANREVVTAIEVLSPANKVRDGAGWRNYRHKRQEILDSGTHLVEIDLLREGDSPTAAQVPGPCEYRVHVSQVRRRPRGWVWPIRLEQRLPAIRIPLRESDPDTELDLQAVFNDTYDRARYGDRIDYRVAPVPPLPAPLDEWAGKLLKEKGLR